MSPSLFLLLPLLVPLPTFALDKAHGVHPSLLDQYTPAGTTWQCLDGSKTIPWVNVNNDYCDCPDGSDEPGTGACPNTTFYCRNEGHVGASIPSSRVNDGLCEVECCDGSDEPSGICPNACKEIGEVYRAKVEAERKIRKTGSKIRSTYVAFAQKEKKRLETEIANSEREIAVREKEVARLKTILDHEESLSAAALELRKSSPLYESLTTHHNALKSLQREYKKHLEREKALGDILDSLRNGYNPNYQDMAVLEAVRGWEYFAGLPHIGEEEKVEEASSEEDKEEENEQVVELEEGAWTEEQLEKDLDKLLKTDHVSLLIEHDKHIGTAGAQSAFDVKSYLPKALAPQYDSLKDGISSLLGLSSTSTLGATGDVSQSRQVYTDAEHSLSLAKKELESAKFDLDALFDVTGFGPEGEWKKLNGLCIEKDTGDYTYEVCLFNEAKQKPNKGGQTFSLGKFSSWHPSPSVAEGSPEYYTQQDYTNGAKCWNGPHRSMHLHLKCGTENALLTVAELEKCEYLFEGTSPALCLPLEDGKKKDEL